MREMIHAGAGVHGGASGLCWGWWSMLEAVVHGVPCWEYWNVLGQWFMLGSAGSAGVVHHGLRGLG